MVFSSVIFLCFFLPCFLAIYYLIPKSFKKEVIVLFSLLFYGWGAPTFIFFLLGSSLLDFLISKNFNVENPKRKISLLFSLFLNVGLLCYFKYVNFFISNLSSEFNFVASIEPISLGLGR